MKKQSILYLLIATFIFVSCSDSGNEPEPPQISSVYVMNEGSFTSANGSITSYDPLTNTAAQTAFEVANDRPFAGTIQSAKVNDGRLFIVSNMVDKIEVVDLETLSSLDEIEYSKTPTDITFVGNAKAYVTNLYDNSVTVVDLENMEETDQTISVGSYPYFAHAINGKVFVSNNGFGGSNTISVIDVASGAVENTITVGAGPFQIAEDPAGQLWVVCEGAAAYDDDGNRDPENDTPGGIFIIDPETQSVVSSIENDRRPTHVTFDERNSRAYAVYAGGNVAQINLNTQEIIDEDFIPRTFDTIGYSVGEELLYLGQGGFTQNGQTIRYNLEGTAVDSFTVGIAPREFEFVEN